MTAPLVYRVEEVAELLALGRTATFEAVRRGEIPSVRIGRSLRVPRHALEQLLNSTATGTDSPQTNGAAVEGDAVKGGHDHARTECT